MKILIVDDYIDNRQLLAQIAEILGYDYLMAENGKRAIEILEANTDIDVVFMDIEMPVMNGFETTVTIRQSMKEPIKSVPVFAITAHNPEDFKDKFTKKGFTGYISKPYTLDKVEEIISKHKIV